MATYNVHCGVGTDGRRDLDRIARVIDEIAPDVIAIQEVMSCDPGRSTDQVAELAQKLGMRAVVGSTFRHFDGTYGNAILTRVPVGAVRRLDISQPGREPRGALDLDLHPGMHPLRVIATHLGLRPTERNRQLNRLLQAEPGSLAHPLVLLGDFNSWLPTARVLRRMRERFGPQPAPRSYPSTRPLFPLDRIWVEPRTALRHLGVHDSSAAVCASDHLPVWARIDA